MCSLILLILQLLIYSNCVFGYTFTGSVFSYTTSYYYEDDIIKCDNGSDCSISCGGSYTCRNTTIYCPTSDNSCSVSCSGSYSCQYTDIHWVQGNVNSVNSLSCGTSDCFRVREPPSISEDEPLLVNCDGSSECYGKIITCPSNAQCQVLCTGSSSCQHAIIYCPDTNICNVVCTGSSACYLAVVHWSYDPSIPSGSTTLACPDGGNQCNLIQAPTIINPPNNNRTYNLLCKDPKECASATINCPSDGHCLINCLNEGSCSGSIINCPSNEDCQILCTGSYSCYHSTINGPNNYVLTVLCHAAYSCEGLTIHAENSEYFYFTNPVYVNAYTAMNTTIYYPARDMVANETKSKIYLANTASFNGLDGYRSQQFYALNGWLDVDIIYGTASFSNQGGTMRCGHNYTKWCAFDLLSWSCGDDNTICDDPFVTTLPPSESPTVEPSQFPSKTPSQAPSDSPSYTPSNNPSIDPTLSPTAEPTIYSNQTRTPTDSTSSPTTSTPTTSSPTTANPTTSEPSPIPTMDPTTPYPTTNTPTTNEPTTAAPTTSEPTTFEPTESPVTSQCDCDNATPSTSEINVTFLSLTCLKNISELIVPYTMKHNFISLTTFQIGQ